MNRIGDLGARALATALRTNRSLMSLSLAGNNISDVGVSYLAEVLQRFLLTQEEILYRRRRIVNRRTQKKQLLEKLMQGWSEGERGGISKTELRSVESKCRHLKSKNQWSDRMNLSERTSEAIQFDSLTFYRNSKNKETQKHVKQGPQEKE